MGGKREEWAPMVAPVEREKLPKREKTKSGGATRNLFALDELILNYG